MPRLASLLIFAAVQAAAGEAQPPADAAQLVDLLENGDFDQRQNAIKQLESLGAKARPALEKALRESDSLDVREAAERLLDAFSRATLVIQALDRTGKPIAAAEADVVIQRRPLTHSPWYPNPDEQVPRPITTNAAGRATLDGFPPGPVTVIVAWKNLRRPDGSHGSTACLLRSGENRLQYVLHRGGSVGGRVLAADGAFPLANANISLIPDTGQELNGVDLDRTFLRQDREVIPFRAVSNAAGEFSLDNVSEGSFLVFAQHPDCLTACGGSVRVREGGATRMERAIQLESKTKALGAVKVQLLNAKDEPLKNTNVSVEAQRVPANDAERAALKAAILQAAMNYDEFDPPLKLSTGADGCVEIKDLRPGNYRIALRTAEDDANKIQSWFLKDIAVAAGQSAAVDAVKPPALGAVSVELAGVPERSLHSYVIWALAWDDPDAAAILSNPLPCIGWLQNSNDASDFKADASVSSKKFEFKRLLPGRYSLLICRNSELIGILHSVEARPETPLVLPPFKLPEPAGGGGEVADIYGVVLLPDGQPAARARVIVASSNSSSATQTSNDGKFSMSNRSNDSPATRLIVHLAGHRPAHVDLTARPLPKSFTIRLEKQLYGSLAVDVRDPEGRPVKGAAVIAPSTHNPYAYYSHQRARPAENLSDRSGRVLLKGLAAGKRKLTAFRDGFYLERPLEIEVLPDTLTPLTITLRPGLILNGVVEHPAGAEPDKVLVALQHNLGGDAFGASFGVFEQTAALDAAGRFQFSGVPPGKWTLVPHAPGLVSAQEKNEIDLNDKTPEARLKLVRAGALKLHFDKPLARREGFVCSALVATGSWDPARVPPQSQTSWIYEQSSTSDMMDSAGFVELKGLRPGPYDLLLLTRDRNWNQDVLNPVASLVFPGLKVEPLNDWKDFESLAPLRLQVPDCNATVRARLRLNCPANLGKDGNGGSLQLTIVGERAVANVAISIPGDFNGRQLPPMTGAPPPGFHLDQPGDFSISRLPAGEYRAYLQHEIYEQHDGKWEPKKTDIGPRPARTFHIAPGQSLDLGEWPVELPPDLWDKIRIQLHASAASNLRQNYGAETGEDDIPAFQP